MKYNLDQSYPTWKQRGPTSRSEAVWNLTGRDLPESGRPDLRVHRTAAGIVYLGAGTQAHLDEFEEAVLPGVREAIESAGVASDLYIEFGVNTSSGDLGGHVTVSHPQRSYHVISLDNAHRTSLYNALHETVHMIRRERGWKKFPRVADEVETVLETVAITPPNALRAVLAAIARWERSEAGYYLVFDDPGGAMLYDRVLLTGSVDRVISIEDAHAKVTDPAFLATTNMGRYPQFEANPHEELKSVVLPAASRRRSRRVVTVRVSARPVSRRMAPGAGMRLFEALVNGRVVTVHVTQEKGVTKGEVLGYLSKRLRATAVWECRGCRKVRVA